MPGALTQIPASMDSESKLERRAQLLARLENYPLLRMLVAERWFRVGFTAFLLVLIFMGLFLPRIWKATPDGFKPVIRIRGLHYAQALMLKRTARQAVAAGKFEQADYAWRSAISRNPGDKDALRGYVGSFLQRGRTESKQLSGMIGYGTWLLRLTETNVMGGRMKKVEEEHRMDAELLARVCDKHRLYDVTLYLLVPLKDKLEPEGEAALIRATFHSGQIQPFVALWEKARAKVREAPDMPLYWAAYLTGWGPPGRIEEGQKALQAALQRPDQQLLASRLEMLVRAHAGEAEGYRVAFERLQRAGEDAVADHALYWRLLAADGRKEEARGIARSFIRALTEVPEGQKGEPDSKPDGPPAVDDQARPAKSSAREPGSAGELIRLVRVSDELGLQEEAIQLLQKQALRFGYSEDTWITYAELLMASKRWKDLRELATQIRQESGVRDALEGYSFYLQGRAELGLERTSLAQDAFEQVRRLFIPNRNLALATAYSLAQLGYLEVARDLLLNVEKDAASAPAYWQTLFYVAYRLRDSDLLLRSGGRLLELRPDDLVAANNYAAALLVARERPEEAVKLTMRVFNQNPKSTASIINRSLALLLSGRTDEAAELLRGVSPERLNPEEAVSYYLALFEVQFSSGQYPKAWETSDKLDPKKLFPVQMRWLEECRKKMPARAAAR